MDVDLLGLYLEQRRLRWKLARHILVFVWELTRLALMGVGVWAIIDWLR